MLHKLQWRYATKKFDPTKKVEEDTIKDLLQAMNLAASSYGLQPYKFVVVHNDELQKKLQEAAYGQPQVVDASHLVIITARTEITENDIDEYIQNIATTRNQSIESLQEYAESMKQDLLSREKRDQLSWSQRQSYIPLGTLLLTAADKKVDACPMEGFKPKAFNEILELEGFHATAMIALGYRSVNDTYQHAKKVRKKLTDITTLKYK